MSGVRLAVAGALAGVLLGAGGAGAADRQGFVWGFSVGGGSLSCDGCESESGVAVGVHAGGMIDDKMAILFDGQGVGISEPDDSTTVFVVDSLALRYWVADRLWVQGGVGIGSIDNSRFGKTQNGLGFMAGGGFELTNGDRFVLDLQGRFGTADIDGQRLNSVSAHLGFNWY
jgi:hypothetical protein